MKASVRLMLCLSGALAAAGGCAADYTGGTFRRIGGLTIGAEVPRHVYYPGERIPLTVTTVNQSDHPVAVDRMGSVEYFVTVSRNEGLGWELVRQYPSGTAGVLQRVVFRPGQVRRTTITVPVERDWPTGEVLRLQARMNGREEVASSDFVEIRPW
jgi:hypothetical protein